MFHQEADRIPAAATTEAFVNFFSRGDRERRSFLVMKWTEAKVIGSPFFQFNKSSDNVDDVNPAKDLLYGLLANHLKKSGNFADPRINSNMVN